jgi:hypothetical protein
MPDDKKKPGGQDRKRINVNEEYEVRDWSKKFGVTQRAKESGCESRVLSGGCQEASWSLEYICICQKSYL